MYIQTEATPNPHSLKFILGELLLDSGSMSFSSADEARSASPLAANLLEIEAVEGVFISQDFVTITKSEATPWEVLKPMVLNSMMDHIMQGGKLLHQAESTSPTTADEDEISTHIRDLIETRVRPAVAQDGGDIMFRSFENGVVKVTLRGSCSGCPSSSITLKNGIENMLKYYVPEVTAVEAVA